VAFMAWMVLPNCLDVKRFNIEPLDIKRVGR
jgi:hypothetical protein